MRYSYDENGNQEEKEESNFYFECTVNGHRKFWAIEIMGKNGVTYLIRRYGKIGQAGKTMTEEFDYRAQAERRKRKLVEEKLEKGYKPIM
jgi:predicted DNA-binding WGR domain protein